MGGMFALALAALLAFSDSMPECRAQAPRAAARYEASVAPTLAGLYDLTLVETKPRPGAPVTGRLELLAADSIHRWTVAPLSGNGPRPRGLDRPLWGTVEFDGRPSRDSQPLVSRDPDHPAVVLIADGRLLLRSPAPAIFHLELQIERVGAVGMWGRWTERRGLQVVASTGPNWGPSSGYFCAARRSTTRSPGA